MQTHNLLVTHLPP